MDHWGRVGMGEVSLAWARDKLREEVAAFADDPRGYCGDETTPNRAWQRIEHIAGELGMDAGVILVEDRTPYEIARLEDLTGRDFG